MAVNFTKNQVEITKAWKDVVDSKSEERWALFGYEGNTNNIRLMSTGTNGLTGLVDRLNCSLIQYGFCRVISQDLGINKLILINWQGDSSPLSRKGLCASHVADVANYFKGCTQTITIRNDDEATPEYLMEQITKSGSTSRINIAKHHDDSSGDSPRVGSSYGKTNIRSDIPADRKSFWQQQEEEEKERLIEEKKRAAEKQAQFERERKAREESEAKKLAEAIRERDRLIDATRQAERRESSTSQPNSLASTVPSGKDDDDERVGRRSELIRLERNQETQSLIGKGLIKNKRAIFEQASQQQQQRPPQASVNTMSRKSSGTMVASRLNSFKSLETTSSPQDIEKLSNGLEKQVNLGVASPQKSVVSEKIETIKISDDMPKTIRAEEQAAACPTNSSPSKVIMDEVPTNGNSHATINGSDSNGGQVNDSSEVVPNVSLDDLIYSGKTGIKARAMYDYEATDDTEISFDPDDIIGFIEKVDPGWWHGSVITGRFQGQSGLFPANHVQEF